METRLKLRACYKRAEESTDTSTKLGAILCMEGWNAAYGVNKFVAGFGDDPADYERPRKYEVTEHAERNCLFAASRRFTTPFKDSILICPWVTCPDCARVIVAFGVPHVICHKECMDRTPERWRALIDTGLLILKRGGVIVTEWSGKVGDVTNLNNGEIWEP